MIARLAWLLSEIFNLSTKMYLGVDVEDGSDLQVPRKGDPPTVRRFGSSLHPLGAFKKKIESVKNYIFILICNSLKILSVYK